jgi:dTDP-4-dehydrorhamnose reductase
MLGRDTADAVAARGHSAIGLPRQELDVTDVAAVEEAFAAIRPHAVINCAAWTDVDGAEANERAAMQVNDSAAGIVSSTAAAHGASVLYVSSDYVFDGAKGSAYVESDLPAAISAYGRSKQAGETSTQIANPRHFIVRSSWLFGAGGPNFVETMLRAGIEQPEVIVVNDQVASPTYTRHLAQALALVIESDEYGIHHIAAGGRCSWFDYAQEIFDQVGLDTRVMAGSTAMLGRPAPRPALSLLVSERPDPITLPDWRHGLAEYLAAREARAPA